MLLFSNLPPFRLPANLHKPAVFALLADELRMRALLNDAAIVKHQNLVGVFNRRQPVRNVDDGLAARQFGYRLLNQVFILRIDARGSFVPISTTSANPHKTGTFQKSKDN